MRSERRPCTSLTTRSCSASSSSSMTFSGVLFAAHDLRRQTQRQRCRASRRRRPASPRFRPSVRRAAYGRHLSRELVRSSASHALATILELHELHAVFDGMRPARIGRNCAPLARAYDQLDQWSDRVGTRELHSSKVSRMTTTASPPATWRTGRAAPRTRRRIAREPAVLPDCAGGPCATGARAGRCAWSPVDHACASPQARALLPRFAAPSRATRRRNPRIELGPIEVEIDEGRLSSIHRIALGVREHEAREHADLPMPPPRG